MSAALPQRLSAVRARVDAVAKSPVQLVAVSKLQPAAAIRAAATLGQREFGENYVQEALAKMRELADLDVVWHLIGPLQSNKCRPVAEHFDWLQTLDRVSLIAPLARHRPASKAPLNVLIQVNIDDEDSKSGVAPDAIPTLAAAVVAEPRLSLRGLMAIPRAWDELERRRESFVRLRGCFDELRMAYPQVDTLSMGMSEDFELAIAAGATLVRVGSAIFGARTTHR
jgi:pyridoxal phosphate enzyme (YggS family)